MTWTKSLLLLLAACLFIFLFLLAVIKNPRGNINTASSSKPTLKEAVNKVLSGTKGNYAAYIKNLKTGETFAQNEHESFEAGSLYKLWLLGAVFEKIKDETLKEDEILSGDITDLNTSFDIASDEAELTEGQITLTAKDAIEQMITISHNYSALLLTSKVGSSKINDFILKYGFNESSVDPSIKTTASDMARFFEELYAGRIIDKEYSEKMLEILSRQKISDRIPEKLPQGIKVAHKTADIGFFEHDVGIVYSEKGDYIIVVLTETEFPQAAGEKIADLSEAVYNYFDSKR